MKYNAVAAPDWLARSAVYQINLRTFSKEGTLRATAAELPFLASLGFGVMYLCPIFEADPSCDRANWSDRQKQYGTNNPNHDQQRQRAVRPGAHGRVSGWYSSATSAPKRFR